MSASSTRPRVVIVGAGFAGLAAARALEAAPASVLVIDRQNYHTFTPLLYQVASAGLEPDSIVKPVRAILSPRGNARFRMAAVRTVHLGRRSLQTDNSEVAYDFLILAAGSTVNFFGPREIEARSLPLKDLDDAIALRSRVLAAFERAVLAGDPAERRRLMTIAVVGGGPTGVELAGAIAELRTHVLKRDFPELDTTEARVVLIEATGALLPGFPPALQRAALRQLRELGVDVMLDSPVAAIDEQGARLRRGDAVEAATVAWVAGVRASELGRQVSDDLSHGGRVPVLPTLQLLEHPEVFVAGDVALLADAAGRPLPMMAPVAIQQGEHAAKSVRALLEGRAPQPFRYRDRGMMATVGRQRAVAYIRPLKLSGALAWVAWLTIHLFWLIGYRNKFLVLVDWAWNYLFYESGARLITAGARRRGADDE